MAPKGRGKKVADVAVNVVVEGIGAKKRSRPEKGKINEAKNVINGETPESITTEEQTALAPSSVDKGKSKRQQKPIKTVNEEESSKVEEKEENVKAKRGRKGKIENGDLDSVNSAEVKQKTETDGEVKELPTRSRRKEPAVVEQGNLKKENKSQAKEMKGKAHKKTAPVQLAEDMVEKEAPSRGAGRKRKNAVEKTESETAESVKGDETFVVDENRQLRVAIKRNRKLDEMAVNEKSNGTEVKNAKGPSKSKGKRVAKNSDEDSKPIKKVKEDASKSKSSSKKEKIPDVTALDFSNDSKSVGGKPWNLKIATWNVNGVRAWLEKNGMSYLHHEKPDILTIQETKCSQDKLPAEVNVDGYECYWLSGDKDGYSGIGLLSKKKPLTVEYGIGIDAHDNEGRVITAEYDEFYLVTTYVPNAGRGLVRLDYRQEWDKDFRAYLKKLDEKKPVVLCGDLNVAHEEIDLANPKTNKKNAGFTKEERDGFSALLSEGFVDTFRHFYPKESGAYTFWTYMMNARAKNVGWRLDYFVTSKRFVDHLCDSVIRKDVYGSDHCPITLFLHV